MCIFEWCEVWIGGLTEPSAGSRLWWNPGFSRVGRLRVGDGALLEVDVETQEVEIVHRLEFHWVAKEVVVDEGLDGGMV